MGGGAHTSKWQGSLRLKRDVKQRAIKSQRGEGGARSKALMNTVKHGDGKGKHRGMERGGERGSAPLISPPLKPRFIILRDPLYRLAAFRLFVILVTQG